MNNKSNQSGAKVHPTALSVIIKIFKEKRFELSQFKTGNQVRYAGGGA